MIHHRSADSPLRYAPDRHYHERIVEQLAGWNIPKFKEALKGLPALELIERRPPNPARLSYRITDTSKLVEVIKKAREVVQGLCPEACSYAFKVPGCNFHYLEILAADKLTSARYLQNYAGVPSDSQVLACGDSSNDLSLLTAGYFAVVVRNAADRFKDMVKQSMQEKGWLSRLHIASGLRDFRGVQVLNGCYVSGVLEGMYRFGLISAGFIGRQVRGR